MAPSIDCPYKPLRAPHIGSEPLRALHTDESPTDPLSIQATEGPTYLLAKSLAIPRAHIGTYLQMRAPHIDCPPRPLRAPHTDKEPLSEHQNARSEPAVTISDMESQRVLLGFWGTQAQTGPSQSWDGPPNLTLLFFFLFSFF